MCPTRCCTRAAQTSLRFSSASPRSANSSSARHCWNPTAVARLGRPRRPARAVRPGPQKKGRRMDNPYQSQQQPSRQSQQQRPAPPGVGLQAAWPGFSSPAAGVYHNPCCLAPAARRLLGLQEVHNRDHHASLAARKISTDSREARVVRDQRPERQSTRLRRRDNPYHPKPQVVVASDREG